MFVLAELRDRIRIMPEQFHLHVLEAINDELNRKLSNKVVLNVGLVISLYSIVSVGDSMLVPGDGAAHADVIFRALVFRPMIGSILTGKIRSCSREGVHVTLGFFDDILLPREALQHPSRFEETEQAWIWEYPLANGESHDLFLDIGEPIKFRVLNEIFEEPSPLGPPNMDPIQQQEAALKVAHKKEHRIPYRIIGSINESGLGVLRWWESNELDGGEEEEEGGEEEEGDETAVEGEVEVDGEVELDDEAAENGEAEEEGEAEGDECEMAAENELVNEGGEDEEGIAGEYADEE